MSPTNTDVTTGPADLDPCGPPEHPDCGIRDVLDRVGDKWSVLVIVELANGTRRFRQLQRAVDGISQRMLTLTETGEGLTHLIKALADWSLAHRDVVAQARHTYDAAHPDNEIR